MRSRSRHRRRGGYGFQIAATLIFAAAVGGGLYLDNHASDQVAAQAAAANLQAKTKQEQQELLAAQQAMAVQAAARAEAEARLAAERAKIVEQEASRRGTGRALSFGPMPAGCNEYSGNRAIGCAVLLNSGWGLDQMPCLDKLWTRESGWNHRSENKSSGAYGIPQSLPGDKMAAVAPDWKTNPATQIKWGLSYIDKRYGSPCKAWQHSEDFNWY